MIDTIQFNKVNGDGFPAGPEYMKTVRETVLFQDENVTLFQGCKLHINARDDVWMSPAIVTGAEEDSYFNILYVGSKPEYTDTNAALPVYFSPLDEVALKLSSIDGPLDDFTDLLLKESQSIIIRKSKSGMPYYPNSIVPSDTDDSLDEQLQKISTTLGIGRPISIESSPSMEINTGERMVVNGKDLYVYEIILDDDPWKLYNIFAARELQETAKEDVLVRIDSCCEIGQVYNDNGCDCREQLHTAIEAIQDSGNGIIIHVPAQDGRGYGSSTIMKIVGLERGDFPDEAIEGATDGVAISGVLLGDRYDNRTYGGVGRILQQLGITSVKLQTDNKLKIEGVRSAGIEVFRKATETKGANGSLAGVQIKHTKTQNYIRNDSDDSH